MALRRRRRAVAVAAVVAVVAVIAVVLAVDTATGPHHAATRRAPATATRQVPRSVPSAPAADLTAACGTVDPAPTLGPAPTLPSGKPRSLGTVAGGIVDFVATATGVYIETPTDLVIDDLSGRHRTSFALPAALRTQSLNSSSLVVDPAGDVYIASYLDGLVDKLSPGGRVLWSSRAVAHPTGLWSLGRGATFRIAVSPFPTGPSVLLDEAGQRRGTSPVTTTAGAYVTEDRQGDLLVAADGHVQVRDASGDRLLSELGGQQDTGKGTHTGGPYQSYYPGQAVEAPDGTLYTADPLTTIESSDAGGDLQATTTLGGDLQMAGGYLYLVGGELYLEAGTAFSSDTYVASLPLSTLQAYLAAPAAALDTLGWGAGLDTTAAGNYFPSGRAPDVYADLAPWWAARVPRLRLTYSVWDAADLAAIRPEATTVRLPATATGLEHVDLPIPGADGLPGPYEVEAALYDTATTPARLLGSTCLPYAVGAPGDRLDLATLPSGSDSGGPADPRGVALASELGLDGLRSVSTIDWSTYLPHCDASAPTAAECGPGAMTFANAPTAPFVAAGLARRDHVEYWVQVSGGDPVSLALAHGGEWGADVQRLVAYYSHPPASCHGCAPVAAWEAWNEPNNTGWSTGASYVHEVLAPFYRGVKAADPAATVIGGSTLEVPIAWWRSLIAAHGLSYLDVAAVHPYTGNNESFEEDGILTQVRQLQGLLGRVPLWFTEVGWWSDGDYNVLNQADDVARAEIWQRILGIPVWNYYFSEGAGDGGVSFSLVETGDSGDDYVKAAALAAMSTAHELAGRAVTSTPATGIPGTYEADFGAASGGSGSGGSGSGGSGGSAQSDVAAVWSDGLAVTGVVRVTSPHGGKVPVTVVDEYGRATGSDLMSGHRYALPIGSSVTYLVVPRGDRVQVAPTSPYGPDLATSGRGATASASSGDAGAAITGSTTGTGWSSSPGDRRPSLTVDLPAVRTLDRVVVDTQSPGSTATGLRTYDVSVRRPDHRWVIVGRVVGEYKDHQDQIAFAPTAADAVRITVSQIDYGGYAGGGIPSFWPASQPGVAFVHAIEVYGGQASPATIDGVGLTGL